MWICSKYGFFSIVKKLGGWHVRARCRADLEALKAAAKLKGAIGNSLTADYAWRIVVQQRELGHVFAALRDSIDYANFKGQISVTEQRDKLWMYHRWWEDMMEYQGMKGGK